MIHALLAQNPGHMTGGGTNTYLVEDGAGGLAVVDPGPDDPAHVEAILAAARPLGRVVAVLVTHSHADHLPAARPLCARTGAPLLGHPGLPGVDRPLADGETAFAGPSIGLVALHTPGHTDDSACYWDPGSRALFTGDLVAGSGTLVVDEGPGGLARYLASLDRLLALGESTLYPGHGPTVPDGAARLRQYLEHRQQRERQVVEALRAHGPASPEDLVAAIYPADLAAALVPMAARNVRAHLGKLADERRVVAEDGRWRLNAT